MTQIPLTEDQKSAIGKVKQWFKNDTAKQQVYRIFGYAGTGKSTIVKYAIEELGLNNSATEIDDDGDAVPPVLYGTFTGKAAHVLRGKGTPARTIHSLIYAVTEATEEEFIQAQEAVSDIELKLRDIRGADRIVIEALLRQKQLDLRDMRKPRFGLNDQSPIRDCKLVVLDEVSMVGPDMAADILSFGKPVLVLGDPGQLAPIKGEGYFTQATPDVFLTEIHRQAGDSAIIRLATMAREGRYIPFGQHSELVWKIRQNEISPDMLCQAGQVVCGLNATRLMLNNAMRRVHNRAGTWPVGPDEKIICLKNDNEHGLINGMFLRLSDIEPYDETRFAANIETEDGTALGVPIMTGPIEATEDCRGIKKIKTKKSKFEIYAGHFLDHEIVDPARSDRDWKIKRGMVEATFGYAITCHKAQGSGWKNVAVWNDGLGRTIDDRKRWLYTSITRAEEGLLICE